jgi:hypothetical protein
MLHCGVEDESNIIAAEKQWGVDRRAIAGAIAFEALEDVQSDLAFP